MFEKIIDGRIPRGEDEEMKSISKFQTLTYGFSFSLQSELLYILGHKKNNRSTIILLALAKLLYISKTTMDDTKNEPFDNI